MVVEDDPEIQALIDEALCDGGYDPALATSGEEAVTLLWGDRRRYRALVVDISLKGNMEGSGEADTRDRSGLSDHLHHRWCGRSMVFKRRSQQHRRQVRTRSVALTAFTVHL